MAIDLNGTIFGYSAPEQGIVTLDLATGNTAFLAAVDPSVGFISGTAPVPEPRTMVLIAIGMVAAALGRGKLLCRS
jgi:hypothetical protein